MAEAIAQDRKRCQFLFCLVKNPLLCRSAWPEGSREARERFLWRGSVELRASGASACVGRRLSAPQIVWNKSTRRAGCPARERPRLGTRWQAVPERERFYCATSRWAPARRGSESDVNAGAAPAQ